MKFTPRIFFFSFGLCLGILFISILFEGRMKKGFSDYFSGQDRIIRFLINKTDLNNQIQDWLDLSDKDSLFIREMIINTDVEIISREPCFEYLLTPNTSSCLTTLLVKKCEETVSIVNLEVEEY